METTRWIIAGAAGLLSLYFIVGNPVAALKAQRQGRNYSAVPFLGAFFGVTACAVCPAMGWSWWLLLPLVLDLTVPMFLLAALLSPRE